MSRQGSRAVGQRMRPQVMQGQAEMNEFGPELMQRPIDHRIKVIPFGGQIQQPLKPDPFKIKPMSRGGQRVVIPQGLPAEQMMNAFTQKYSEPMAPKQNNKYTYQEDRPQTRGNTSHQGTAPAGTRGGTRGGRRTRPNPVGYQESGLGDIFPTSNHS